MTTRLCSTAGCERKIQAREMCTTHWSQWYRENRKQQHACDGCGAMFMRATATAKFCTLECHNASQARGGRRTQARERIERNGKRGSAQWRANQALRKAAQGRSGGARVWVHGRCVLCSTLFTSPGALSKYCSRGCRQTDRGTRMYGLTLNDRLAIFDRDNWTCTICTEPVKALAHHLTDWYPTLDHIIPRAHGGTNDLSNLRTAHRWCNSVRGDLSHYTDADLAPRG